MLKVIIFVALRIAKEEMLADFPEFIISDRESSMRISRAVAARKLRPLGSRLFTTHLLGDEADLVRRNVWKIAAMYFPDAVVVDRTALEGKPSKDGTVFLSTTVKRDVELPGITFRARQGVGRLKDDYPMGTNLFCSSRARAFVENVLPSRARKGLARTASHAEVEDQLTKILVNGQEAGLNLLRDQIKAVGAELGQPGAVKVLDAMIGTLLGTRDAALSGPAAIAHKSGAPYDGKRVVLFNSIYEALRMRAPMSPRLTRVEGDAATNLAFFEAYFSNFIEGTEFEVDEAEDIIFRGAIPENRPADAHDVRGTFELVSDPVDKALVPRRFDDLLELLRQRHSRIMEGRPEKRPGQFKTSGNKAGATTFVRPEDVVGTLREGYEIYRRLEAPLDRAIFMMFMVAEVHPFADGNGRSARIMMNAELSAGGETRIIVPTVYRSNYLEGLRLMSNHGNPETLIRALDFGQRYVHAIDWTTLRGARTLLDKTNAFVLPEVGDKEGIRLRMPMTLDFITDDGQPAFETTNKPAKAKERDHDGGDGSGGGMSGGPGVR